MKMKIIFLLAATFVLYSAGLFAAAPDECQRDVRAQVIKNNPKVEKVNFLADTETQEQVSSSETLHKGKGEFLRHTGKWEAISWECSYDPKKAAIIKASYSVTQPDAGTPVHALKDLVGTRVGQGEGELKTKGYDFVRTQKLADGANAFWLESRTDYCVLVRTKEGKYESFVYTLPKDCNLK